MSTTVEQALAGHAQVMESINSWTEAEFAQADFNGPYVLRAAGVAKVLRDLQAGCLVPSAAQWWASFVMRGSLATPFERPRVPLDIDYDGDLEDEIATAVMRLDEVGDLIDGEFRPGEIDQLLASLRS